MSWGPDDNWNIPLRHWQKFLGRGREEKRRRGREEEGEERREREGRREKERRRERAGRREEREGEKGIGFKLSFYHLMLMATWAEGERSPTKRMHFAHALFIPNNKQ